MSNMQCVFSTATGPLAPLDKEHLPLLSGDRGTFFDSDAKVDSVANN